MDLLGSILGSMEKPPSMGAEEKKKVKEQRERQEKMQREEKTKKLKFRDKVTKEIQAFVKDGARQSLKFDPMDKVQRSIAHEVADVAGLTSFSFGLEEDERYIMLWKKEFAPSDEELAMRKRGEQWDPEKTKEEEKEREAKRRADEASRKRALQHVPVKSYSEKYQHLIGDDSAEKAAKKITSSNTQYGMVPSANKKDLRTIEQVMADAKAKRQKLVEPSEPLEGASGDS